jgi:exonuclease SbcD
MSDSFTFAHMADVHLGAYSKEFRALNLEAFTKSLDRCLALKVDFVLIAGDLFHINVPDLGVVDQAAAKLREVKDAGVPVYVWYGSHDYSPTEKSIIDVLASTGLFTKVARFEEAPAGAGPALAWTTDPTTGARMVAIAGKALGLDRHLYKALDKAALEREEGFKIFGFHAGVKQFLPQYLAHIEAVELADFPRGFNYYAGGHIHHHSIERPGGFAPFVNPGPTFGSDGRDLLNDEPRGFVVTSVKDGRAEPRLERVEVVKFLRDEIDVNGKSAQQARSLIDEALSSWDVDGRAVVLRVYGELTSGRRAELDLDALYTTLPKKGARAVHIVKAYAVREAATIGGDVAAPQDEIEKRLLAAHLAKFQSQDARFRGAVGLELALALKRVLSEEPPLQRGGKGEFEERLRTRGLELLGLAEPRPSAASPPPVPPAPAAEPAPIRGKTLEKFL